MKIPFECDKIFLMWITWIAHYTFYVRYALQYPRPTSHPPVLVFFVGPFKPTEPTKNKFRKYSPVRDALGHIPYTKVEPLRMLVGIQIRPQIQFIVDGRYFDGFGQVAGFETWLKHQIVVGDMAGVWMCVHHVLGTANARSAKLCHIEQIVVECFMVCIHIVAIEWLLCAVQWWWFACNMCRWCWWCCCCCRWLCAIINIGDITHAIRKGCFTRAMQCMIY